MKPKLPLLAVLLLAALPAVGQESPTDPTGANKALVRRYIEEVLAAGRLDQLDALIAPDYVDSTPDAPLARGPEAVRAAQKRVRDRFEGIRYTIDQLIAEGDRVVARYIVAATLKKDDQSPAAGRSAEFAGMTIFRVVDGRIKETWVINDQLEMFRQLGFTLTPPKQEGAKPEGAGPGVG